MEKLVLIDGNSIMNRAFYGIMGSKALTTKDGKYTNGIVVNPENTATGTQLPHSRQVIGILVDDVDATSTDKVGVIATDAVANLNKITFASGQTLALIAGTLQAKNLKLEGWNK